MKAADKERRVVDALYRISSIAAETESSAKAFEVILEEVMRVLPANSASLSLLNPDTGCLEIEFGKGLEQNSRGFSLSLGQGITGWVALHKKPLLVPDVTQDPRYYPIKDSIRCEMAAPLEEGKQTVGVLNVDAVDDHHLGKTELFGEVPYLGGTNLDAVCGVGDYYSQIGHLQRGAALSEKIQIARCIDDIESALQPLGMQQRCVDRKLSLLLGFMVVRHRGSLVHAAEPVDFAGVG